MTWEQSVGNNSHPIHIKRRTRLMPVHNTTLGDYEQTCLCHHVNDDDNVFNNNASINWTCHMLGLNPFL